MRPDPGTSLFAVASPQGDAAYRQARTLDVRAVGSGVGFGVAGQVTVYQGTPGVAARSAYLQQVRRIAPPDPPGLVGREPELAELAQFCLDPGRGPYVWWRAGAWAGKSALLSTFVLQPPQEVLAGRVRVVSFFITARLAAQDTREAFTEVLLEQLAELTGQDLPGALPEATREAFLLDLLAQAANVCREAGGRLVLVVDGLDEDHGVITGPQAHSIAGLLPASPPAGMRVILAGRPNPPVPDDVPDWHPLRDPSIIRLLPDSPYARNVGRLSGQELQRLLRGTMAEQDLLGLLAAAVGGLSSPDLGELAGLPISLVEQVLHTVAGRTFTRRPSRLRLGTAPAVYMLGHEELQAAADRYLGTRLADYHERLHEWADTYRARGWPSGTPEYLLSGYYRLLASIGDLPRMIACAGDRARHDRMLELTGGDGAALAEVRAALDLITVQDTPDLAAALGLACHRDQLTSRNTSILVSVPAVWATLGQLSRAEALASSISHPDHQAQALARVAAAMARAGQRQQAEALARSIADPDQQAWALAQVAGALARAGQRHQAKMLARSITDPDRQAQALARVAAAMARAGQRQQAEALARSITSPERRAQALARVAAALAEAGQHPQATATVDQAEALARSITSPERRAQALARVAAALAEAGQHQRAKALARSIASPERRARALAQVAAALAEAGQDLEATAVADQTEALAPSITDPYQQAEALAQVAAALAKAGQHKRAEALACTITNPYQQAEALAGVAAALAEAGQDSQATATVDQAEALVRTITSPYHQLGV
jgi:tetratricopeptide (TPR) repeat protein